MADGEGITFPPERMRAIYSKIADAKFVEYPGTTRPPYYEKTQEWNELILRFFDDPNLVAEKLIVNR